MEELDVRLDGVTKRFGHEVAVDNLSLNVPRGEYLCMLGPSGCGKTTTLRMIAGLLNPDEGDIYLAGDLVNQTPVHKRCTSIVFQSLALFPHLTVEKNVAFGLKMRGVSQAEQKAKVGTMLEMMGLEALAQRMPEELSTGEQQRTALAKSLIIQPRVLLLDEPLSNIDTTLKTKILTDLQHLHNRLKMTFIHVTHDPEEAMANADRIVLMNRGRIEQLDTPRNIFDCPRNRFVAEFFRNSNILGGRVKGHEDDLVIVEGESGRFKVRYPWDKPALEDEVSVVVRHDKAQISTSEGDFNQVSGTVIGEEVVGAVISYILKLNEETEFRFQTHMSTNAPRLEPHKRVTVGWGVDDANLIT